MDKDDQGNIIRKVGVMGIVLIEGHVRLNDRINIELPDQPHHSRSKKNERRRNDLFTNIFQYTTKLNRTRI